MYNYPEHIVADDTPGRPKNIQISWWEVHGIKEFSILIERILVNLSYISEICNI